MYTSFSVTCSGCGHRNKPDRSPYVGIKMVLEGTWKQCRKCGKEFNHITVPNRPQVQDFTGTIVDWVQIIPYTGRVPSAVGR